MALKIICSGYLIRYPVGGFTWHHLQYLIGFVKLGHEVVYLEEYGWPDSCYDPGQDVMSSNPTYGIQYLSNLLKKYNLDIKWCYKSKTKYYGISREELKDICKDSDILINISNINWFKEFELINTRVLIDTDPVFTQIGVHGSGGPFSNYNKLFTFGENINEDFSDMPDAGYDWIPTRQPMILDLWQYSKPGRECSITTVMNWAPLKELQYNGVSYGQKNKQFEPFYDLPSKTTEKMEIACKVQDISENRLLAGKWIIRDPNKVAVDTEMYQNYIKNSKAEFSVAKHGYVSTKCGWFSERSACYLASGRPVIIEDTGFSHWIETGSGILSFSTFDEAQAGIELINANLNYHSKSAREIVDSIFDYKKILNSILELSIN